jgi:hypothetical protein
MEGGLIRGLAGIGSKVIDSDGNVEFKQVSRLYEQNYQVFAGSEVTSHVHRLF